MELTVNKTYRDRLSELLSEDLNFHDATNNYTLHNFHSFPAKFPPQLPNKFIMSLSDPNDLVLDPMMGSGTTVLEACLCGRRGIGFDIDPLAILIAKTKVSYFDTEKIEEIGVRLLDNVKRKLKVNGNPLIQKYKERRDDKTNEFIDFWFASETQEELIVLVDEIEKVENELARNFLKVVFSGIIITKSGGVSLSFDLAHTRPHHAKIVLSKTGEVIFGNELINSSSHRVKILTKRLRPTLKEYEKRFSQNLKSLKQQKANGTISEIRLGRAQELELSNSSVDLIITSPPYASNAIDYMRAHKFTLVWFGYKIDELSRMRREYIGGDSTKDIQFEKMPEYVSNIISQISKHDKKKGLVLHRYYTEMKQTLKEMFRVLKPDKSAIVVIGNSVMRNIDTDAAKCLTEIGKEIGFEVPKIGIRDLDRNKRMLPTGAQLNLDSQIQKRMHEEYVIGFYKPIN